MTRPPLLDHLATLADELRCRILLACERQELTVTELCQILQLPQSTTSRHLKQLSDHGWLQRRREGAKSYYRLASADLAATERRVWLLVREAVEKSGAWSQDRRRLASVLADRRSRSAEFFSSSAQAWRELRYELFGSRFDLVGLLGFLDPSWTVGDLGCGSGDIAATLSPFVEQVVAIDESEAMLAAAAARLEGLDNVEIRQGALESLPLEDSTLDAATLFLVLHHTADPSRVLREAARVLRTGGSLLIVDMLSHTREELRQQMGHVWLGFDPDELARELAATGFHHSTAHPLPEDPTAKGPSLFVLRARDLRANRAEIDLESKNRKVPTTQHLRSPASPD